MLRQLKSGAEFDPAALKVIVASDDAQFRAEVVAFVRGLGCQCIEAGGSPAALELLASNLDCNILVADVNMVEMDGVQLVERARKSRGPGTFLSGILVATKNDPELPVRALHARASDLVLRPAIREHLEAALRRAFQDFVDFAKPTAVRQDLQVQINEIAASVLRLNQRLQEIARETSEALSEDEHAAPAEALLDRERMIETVRRMIRDRKVRERFFPQVRFGEPAWDMLLDLALAWLEGNAVSVSSVCIASGAPMSTAMRWINEMVEAGLIERRTDPTDGRRNFVNIAPATMQAMLRYLAAISRHEAQNGPGQSAAGRGEHAA